MRTTMAGGLTLVMAAALALPAGAQTKAGPEDDLAVVRRAVAQNQASPAPTAPPRVTAAPPRSAASDAGRWLRVRVVDKKTTKPRVTVNVPLSVVRALGDLPFELDCYGRRSQRACPTIRLAEILDALDSGQPLVEIDDEEAFVKVWID